MMMLGFQPVTYNSTDRANRCPVFYNVQRVEGAGTMFKIWIMLPGGIRKEVELHDLNKMLQDHMEEIKKSGGGVSSEPVFVTIKTDFKDLRSVVLVDMMGYENLKDNADPEDMVEKIKKVNNSILAGLERHDILLLVKDGQTPFSSDFLWKEKQIIDSMHRQNCLLCVTKVNTAFQNKNKTDLIKKFKDIEDNFEIGEDKYKDKY